MRIDHVIYATADLDAAAARVEDELGLPVVEGGRHEGMGTVNRIVPLGPGYLELIAVADPEDADEAQLGRAVQARVDRGDGLLGWAVVVDDLRPVSERLGLTITSITREGLSARLAGLTEAMREPCLPFFVERDPGVADPGAKGSAGGIAWLELAGDEERLAHWGGGADLPLRVMAGEPELRRVGIGRSGTAWPSPCG